MRRPMSWCYVLEIYLFLSICGFFVFYLCSIERVNVLDNDNYLAYFSNVEQLDRFWGRILNSESIQNSVALFFTEEALWLIYASLMGEIFGSDISVLLTIGLLNSLIFYSLWSSGAGFFGIVLWVILPVCMSILGFYQIRQGLAIAVFLYIYLCRGRLLLGALVAALIHTTFIVPLVLAFLLGIKKLAARPYLFLLIISALFIAVCYVANSLFVDFAGRRAEAYDVSEGAGSFNFIIVVLMTLVPSVYLVYVRRASVEYNVYLGSLMHIGVGVWLIAAFFLFPIGTSRVGYFIQIFSIFPVALWFWRLVKISPIVVVVYVLAMSIYIWGGIRDGLYSQIFL